MPLPDRSAHDRFEQRHRDMDARLRRRLEEIADSLELHPPLRRPFLLACESAAHFHSADCALATFELRSARSEPAEDELRREAIQEREWAAIVAELKNVAREERRAAESEARPESPGQGFQVRYRPMSSIRRPAE
ncbi:MAG TPA: hypothetical protein VMK65_05045 [Longimicrobiales bacterium]|nr:hypothetical protein [Longimicrobiales bacterium]